MADEQGAATVGGSTAAVDAPPAVFRTPRSALVAVVFLALCLSPIAFQGGPWFLLFLIPLAVAVWVVRTKTVVDGEGLRVHTVWGSTRWAWSRVTTLRLVDRGWVRAVGPPPDGTEGAADELVLRFVRIRDLGRLGEASGGRLAAPTPAEARAAVEHDRELEAARMRIAALRDRQAAGADDPVGAEDATDEPTSTDARAEGATGEPTATADPGGTTDTDRPGPAT